MGLPASIAPSAYFHLGYGWLSSEGRNTSISREGLILDAGLALDFRLGPFVTGLYRGYQSLRYSAGDGSPHHCWQHWLKVGLQLESTF